MWLATRLIPEPIFALWRIQNTWCSEAWPKADEPSETWFIVRARASVTNTLVTLVDLGGA